MELGEIGYNWCESKMNETGPGSEQPVIIEERTFVVNVKLLSNEVYEIQARPDMLVSDFKKKIAGKIGVPVDKQRLVFSGKQLTDSSPISQYVKESGLTVHLIAKSAQPQTNPSTPSTSNAQSQPQPQPQSQPQPQTQPQPTTQNQQNQGQQNQQNLRPPIGGPLNLGSMFSSIFGGGRPNPQSSQQMNETLNQAFGGLGNIEIRMVSGPGSMGPPGQNTGMQSSQPLPGLPGLFGSLQRNASQQSQPQPQQPQQQPQQQQSQEQQQQSPQPFVNLQQGQPQLQQSQSEGQALFTVNQGPLVQLQTTINKLNLPSQQIPPHLNPRDQTIMYLRRLQSEILRFVPHLNRSIQLMQEGRVTHLPDLIPIFHSLNFANSGAVDVIQRYLSLHQQQQQFHQHHHLHRPNQGQNNQQNSQQINPNRPQEGPQNFGNQQRPNQNNENPSNIWNQQQQRENQNQQQINNPFEMLRGLTAPNSGFNFANLFRPQPQPQSQQQTPNNQNSSKSEKEKPGKDPKSIPQPETQPENATKPTQSTKSNAELGKTGEDRRSIPQPEVPQNVSNRSEHQNQSNSGSAITGNNPNSIPQPEPLDPSALKQQLDSVVIPVGAGEGGSQGSGQGVNLMGLFNNIQQNGGIGDLLSMSLGDMVDEGEIDPIYRDVWKVISGSEIIGMFTVKNFSFLNSKRAEFKEAFLKVIAIASTREQLVSRYCRDVCGLLMPEGEIKNKDQCEKRLLKLSKGHIQRIVSIFVDGPAQVNAEVEVLKSIKLLYCESVQQIAKYAQNLQFVFQQIKANTVKLLDKYAAGLSGLFYGIIERDLFRIYREYSEEKKRKQEMTEEEAQDEAELLEQIESGAEKDVDFMASFQHSKYYPASQ